MVLQRGFLQPWRIFWRFREPYTNWKKLVFFSDKNSRNFLDNESDLAAAIDVAELVATK